MAMWSSQLDQSGGALLHKGGICAKETHKLAQRSALYSKICILR